MKICCTPSSLAVQSAECRSIKKDQEAHTIARERNRAVQVDNMQSSIDMGKYLDPLQTELRGKLGSEEESQINCAFIVDTMESTIKAWHENGKVDPRVYFLLDKQKTCTAKYAPVVNIDKSQESHTCFSTLVHQAFESPQTHSDCFTFLRQYAVDSFSKAACLVAPKSIISYPQVWKGQGTRKWKYGQSDGFFVQFESPVLRKQWFVPSSSEMGRTLCTDPELLDVSVHEVLPRIFIEAISPLGQT
ncbi:RNA polymerase II-associated protein 3 isoform X2 [Iris pallida]|uniref:RNA polymerase II-associated protein 3 isoform X2 n=1 Tax=Iris pallida TaxID=29817 RepID=A0AAX6I0G3_IRIPA|nr:RNA polymerase II-associated protein 3 isoform X2 [Iris pallida]